VEGLPKEARELLALMDRHGKLVWLKQVRILIKSDGTSEFVVIKNMKAKVEGSKLSSEAKVRAGDEEVTLRGSFDPATGKVTASVEVKKVPAERKKIAAEVKRKPGVDIIPKALFDVLRLPEHPMIVGKTLEIKWPFGKMKTCLKEIFMQDESQVGHLHFVMTPPKKKAGGMPGGMPGMPEGMPGMPGGGDEDDGDDDDGDDDDWDDEMQEGDEDDDWDDEEEEDSKDDEPGMPKGFPGMKPAAAMPNLAMSTDLHGYFDLTQGKLVKITGNVGMTMKMPMGMGEWKVKTDYVLNRVK
jgi:hypothetical protein